MKEILKRYVVFGIGLLINSFGVSFVTKASLGTSPISSIPYTLSLSFEPSLGEFTLYMSILLIVLQFALLGKNFPKQYLLQIPVAIMFSWFIDLTMILLDFIKPETYIMKLTLLLMGCVILGVGVYLEVLADVVMLPGESFVKAIAVTFNKDFGQIKVVFDTTMTFLAGVIGFVLFQELIGVGEGTLITALLVGMIAKFLKRKLGFAETIFNEKTSKAEEQILLNNEIVTEQ